MHFLKKWKDTISKIKSILYKSYFSSSQLKGHIIASYFGQNFFWLIVYSWLARFVFLLFNDLPKREVVWDDSYKPHVSGQQQSQWCDESAIIQTFYGPFALL